jgi:hypothetical protein
MGYTHYYNHTGIPAKEWGTLIKHARTILDLCGVPTEHEIGEAGIIINGIGEGGHEPFILTPKPIEFQFCKTAQKPYDLPVTAILCVAEYVCGVHVRSDGDAPDWAAGLALARRVFGPACRLPAALEEVEP